MGQMVTWTISTVGSLGGYRFMDVASKSNSEGMMSRDEPNNHQNNNEWSKEIGFAIMKSRIRIYIPYIYLGGCDCHVKYMVCSNLATLCKL
jgi:hypothetical protein